MEIKNKYKEEIKKINESDISEKDKKIKIEEKNEEEKTEIKNLEFKIKLESFVNSSKKKTSAETVECDRLDLASEKNESDMKYYDFPQKTDRDLIKNYKKISKEN